VWHAKCDDVSGEQVNIQKEMVVNCLKVLSWHSCGENKENHKKRWSR
jgi:hypothetical protein